MPLYSLESSHSAPRLANQLIVVDTSYLITLLDSKRNFYKSVRDFHNEALANNAKFFINAVTRQEFIRQVRQVEFIQAIIDAVKKNPSLEATYRAKTNIGKKPFDFKTLKNDYDTIYKHHVREGTVKDFLANVSKNVWEEVKKLEGDADVNFLSESGNYSWEDLGTLVEETGIAAADGIIATFAFNIGASAIVTTDSDFAQITDLIDVYVPGTVADLCSVYDPVND